METFEYIFLFKGSGILIKKMKRDQRKCVNSMVKYIYISSVLHKATTRCDRYTTFLSQGPFTESKQCPTVRKQSTEVSPCSPSGGDSGNCREITAPSARQANERQQCSVFETLHMMTKNIN